LTALRLAGALWHFWSHGNLGEGRRWLQAALDAAEQLDERDLMHQGQGQGIGSAASSLALVPDPDPPKIDTHALARARVKALNGAGSLARLAGDFPAARRALHSGLQLSRELGDRQEVATTLTYLGTVALMYGDFAESRRYQEESLAIRRDLGLELDASYNLTYLGNVAMLEEKYAEARRLHQEGLAIQRKAGDKEGMGHSLHSLATIARRLGDYGEARRLDEETLAIARELGNKQGIAYSLRDLGNVAFEQADYSMAFSSFLESLLLFRELEVVIPTIECLIGLARVASHTGQPGYAVRLFGTAYTMLDSTEGQLDPADTTAAEGDLATLHARLSEKPFTIAWEEGQAMTLDQALKLVSEGNWGQEPGTRKRGSGGLTSREYEVAVLGAQGLSNREIAGRLVLSERTVEMHMYNTLRKLGLPTRTRLANWAVEQGLSPAPD
jgi:DNA-binding CsgD family transcriptional regulator/tetratricopeptide (TPR) repeat protein